MKKTVSFALVILFMITLACCNDGAGNPAATPAAKATPSPAAADSGTAAANQTGDEFKYGKSGDYVANHLPESFSITYRVSQGKEDEFYEMSYTRTPEGHYLNFMTLNTLYIKNGDTYDTYFVVDDNFQKLDFMDPKSEKDVLSEMDIVYKPMSEYSTWSNLNKEGDETVAGRSCERYKSSASAMGVAAYGVNFYIDKETGICLKYTIDIAAGGSLSNMTFECTEFKTSGVSLPDYK